MSSIQRPYSQLPFSFHLQAHQSFEHFLLGENQLAVESVKSLVDKNNSSKQRGIFLYGEPDTGKSHLLLAASIECGPSRSQYLPLSHIGKNALKILEQLEPRHLTCVDDVEQILGQLELETALFDLFNRIHDRNGQIILSSRLALGAAKFALPDLRSRLSSLTQIELRVLPESMRKIVAKQTALRRGFELDEPVIEFLFRRFDRRLSAILALIEKLDHESLAQKRRVTIPFLRTILLQHKE